VEIDSISVTGSSVMNMDTIEVKLVKLNDGRWALKYPATPVIYDMEGYYVTSPGDTNTKVKLTAEQVEALVPKV